MTRVFATILHKQENRLAQAVKTLVFRSALAVGLGNLRAKSDKPITIPMNLGADGQIHSRTMPQMSCLRKVRGLRFPLPLLHANPTTAGRTARDGSRDPPLFMPAGR